MLKRIMRSKINQRIINSLKWISFVMLGLFLAISFGKISGTNSFFMDTATSAGNTMTAGVWIPELTMSVNPVNPDGENGFYKTTPCVTLAANIGGSSSGITIYYEFSNDGDPVLGGTAYSGTCVPIPDGDPTHFQAQAVNDDNSSWVSNIVSDDFKVDTQCSVVEITNPDDGDELDGTVEVRGTVTDANPHHYWLVIQNSSGSTIAGPGTVNDTDSFTDEKFFDWDTTGIVDGDYTIKLEARDEAGNKCPNLAPVLSDPENLNDSVDWIDVEVKNEQAVSAGDVVINEVMWMGSTKDSDDEWIELRNMTNESIDVGQWKLEKVRSAHAEYMIPASKSIPANGYFLIANHPQTSANSDLNVDPDVTNGSLVLYNSDNGNIILKDNNGNIIDEAKGDDWPAGSVDGSSGLHQSMERNNTPGDGTLSGSWHTCTDSACNDTTYWDSEGNNYGTPGHSNLSANDPTSEDYEPSETEEDETAETIENPAVEAPVADSINSPQADPAPATEDPGVETPTPPVDPEVTPEVTPETETEVVPDTSEEPVVEEEMKEEVKEDSVAEEKPAEAPADEEEETKKDEAAKPEEDDSGDDEASDSSANPTD